jgi:hypothetical protein
MVGPLLGGGAFGGKGDVTGVKDAPDGFEGVFEGLMNAAEEFDMLHVEQLTAIARQLDDRPGFAGVEGEGIFDDDLFSGFEGGPGDRAVVAVNRTDNNEVEIRAIEEGFPGVEGLSAVSLAEFPGFFGAVSRNGDQAGAIVLL